MYLRIRVRKAKVQKNFVRNANNYQIPESYLWSEVENKKEIDSNSGKII